MLNALARLGEEQSESWAKVFFTFNHEVSYEE
jgi:hypothetical protein